MPITNHKGMPIPPPDDWGKGRTWKNVSTGVGEKALRKEETAVTLKRPR